MLHLDAQVRRAQARGCKDVMIRDRRARPPGPRVELQAPQHRRAIPESAHAQVQLGYTVTDPLGSPTVTAEMVDATNVREIMGRYLLLTFKLVVPPASAVAGWSSRTWPTCA